MKRDADDLDPEIWGPAPNRWAVCEAQFWNWRTRMKWKILGAVVCRRVGHDEEPVSEVDHWGNRPEPVFYVRCTRCKKQTLL